MRFVELGSFEPSPRQKSRPILKLPSKILQLKKIPLSKGHRIGFVLIFLLLSREPLHSLRFNTVRCVNQPEWTPPPLHNSAVCKVRAFFDSLVSCKAHG